MSLGGDVARPAQHAARNDRERRGAAETAEKRPAIDSAMTVPRDVGLATSDERMTRIIPSLLAASAAPVADNRTTARPDNRTTRRPDDPTNG